MTDGYFSSATHSVGLDSIYVTYSNEQRPAYAGVTKKEVYFSAHKYKRTCICRERWVQGQYMGVAEVFIDDVVKFLHQSEKTSFTNNSKPI